MAKQQKLLLVRVADGKFSPVNEFAGNMENAFLAGWEIAQVGPFTPDLDPLIVLLLEREVTLPPQNG
jgi:hypothetical protein